MITYLFISRIKLSPYILFFAITVHNADKTYFHCLHNLNNKLLKLNCCQGFKITTLSKTIRCVKMTHTFRTSASSCLNKLLIQCYLSSHQRTQLKSCSTISDSAHLCCRSSPQKCTHTHLYSHERTHANRRM